MPVNFNVKTKIKINGKEYNSPDEMPPDVRNLYDKAVSNRQTIPANTQIKTNSRITFNGQTFNSLDEMPADVRRIYDDVMSAYDKNRDGIPDSLQSDGGSTFGPSVPIIPTLRQVAPARSNSRAIIWALAGLVLLILIGLLLLALSGH
jgi:hypothetical protein